MTIARPRSPHLSKKVGVLVKDVDLTETGADPDHLGHVGPHLDRLSLGGHSDPPLLHHRPLQQDPHKHAEVRHPGNSWSSGGTK